MNLRVVRKKIKSIKNVKKITKAMQLVSAVKMRKAQQAEIEGRPYRVGLTSIIQKIVSKIDPTVSVLLKAVAGENKKNLIILISSNKGLAGPFNVNLFRYLIKNSVDFDHTDFVTVGNKGAQFVNRMGANVPADFSSGTPLIEVSAIFSYVVEKFLAGEYSSVSVVYNKFISTTRSEVVRDQMLPVVLDVQPSTDTTVGDYKVEPSPEEIIDSLLKSYIEDKIRGAVISSEAVEHSARMMAMKNATDNATEVIYNLTLLANRLRQEKITYELLDMITAKESVDTN